MSKLHVGCDVSQLSVATRFVLDDGSEPCKGFGFQHNPAGVDKLVAKIVVHSLPPADMCTVVHMLQPEGMQYKHAQIEK